MYNDNLIKMESNNICHLCNKKFKTKKSKTRHIFKEICVPDKDKTYCKICNISTNGDRNAFKKHLISVEHLNKISSLTTRPVEIVSEDIFAVDPYLTNDEKQSISGFKINNLVINHSDNTISKINVDAELKKAELYKKKQEALEEIKKQQELEKRNELERQKKEEEAKKYLGGVHYIAEPENKLDYQSILNAELYTIPPKTERQIRILNFLINCDKKNVSIDDKKQKIKDILRLINLDDANYLMSHIRRCEELSLNSKQFFMNMIDKFIMELVKLLNKGITKIGDKDIRLFVAKLSK